MTNRPRHSAGAASIAAVTVSIMLYAMPAAAAAWLMRAALDRATHSTIWAFEIFIALTTAFVSFWTFRYILKTWVAPMRQLIDGVQQAREREAPIEALSTITGGVAPLVPIVQELL